MMKWSKSKLAILGVFITAIAATIAFAADNVIINPVSDEDTVIKVNDGGVVTELMRFDASEAAVTFESPLNTASEPTLVAEYMTATTTTGAPAAGKFHSEIIGRAPILDLSKIPSGKFGIERLTSTNITQVVGESGPAGEAVYRTDDPLDRIRIYGSSVSVTDNISGKTIGNDNGYVEITCYCTGTNLLGNDADGSRDARARTDGLSEGSNFISAISSVLEDREYSSNYVFPAISGETLGIHTFRIRGNTWLRIAGFEILNEATTVAIPEGSIIEGAKKYTTTATTDDLTTFAVSTQEGSGTILDATVGGHVVRYFDTDSTIKKDIAYTDATPRVLGSTDHSYEEVVQKVHWKRFGGGRADDFTSLAGGSNQTKAFTLDDGTTTLVGFNINNQNNDDVLFIATSSGKLTLTFIGTGLNIRRADAGSSGDIHNIFVDGSSIGTTTPGTTGIQKIVSGLPFGTHTVQIARTAATGGDIGIKEFYIYAPKKPALADGQVEIDSYYKMSDYDSSSSSGNSIGANKNTSDGVLTKFVNREVVYTGVGWTFIDSINENIPNYVQTGSNVDVELSFYGTGAQVHLLDGGDSNVNVQIRIDGVLNATGTPIESMTNDGGGSYTETYTGGGLENRRVEFTGLTLGHHTINLFRAGGGTFRVAAIHVITPTYSYKNSLLNTREDLVGSNNLKNEVLIPGATKNKIIATEGIDLGPNSTKWQRKTLTSNITSAGDVAELSFHGLTPGKTYRITLQGLATYSNVVADALNLQAKDGSTVVTKVFSYHENDLGGDDNSRTLTSTVIHTMASSSLVITEAGNPNSSRYWNAGDSASTFCIVEELPNHRPTKW